MDISDGLHILSSLFRDYFGVESETISRIAGAGSDRVYFRLSARIFQSGKQEVSLSQTEQCWKDSGEEIISCIGVIGENLRDNKSFVDLDRLFHSYGINVPEIYAVSDDGLCYIQEDLGDVSLFSILKEDGKELVAKAMDELVKIQTLPENSWKDLTGYPRFSPRQVMWDLNYFKYEYLKLSGVDFDESLLENDFEKLTSDLCDCNSRFDGFMYRDCQSRNILVKEGELYWIDFQGGRSGPCLYDAISFLWQAKAGFTDDFRRRMLDVYADAFSSLRSVKKEEILSKAGIFALFRTLQVLGAYGFRGLIEKKAHFIESIPGALNNLRSLLESGAVDSYPELSRICGLLSTDERFISKEEDSLTVTVTSFSYKKGYPSDFTGNGGGFMFDCRGLHNPGRYAEYRQLTGLDAPVIEFLEQRGEIQPFVEKAFELVRPTVERYITRGFKNLQTGFGCTGGQHRSVYCAEAFARRLVSSFPGIIVKLDHREQGKQKIYKN